MVGLLLAFAPEVQSLIVPAWLLLEVLEGAAEFEEQLRLGWSCFKKGSGKPPPRKEKAFVLAGLPGVAFS